jgi:hypothetical protein
MEFDSFAVGMVDPFGVVDFRRIVETRTVCGDRQSFGGETTRTPSQFLDGLVDWLFSWVVTCELRNEGVPERQPEYCPGKCK